MRGSQHSTSSRGAPSGWIYLLAAPIVLVMSVALVNDPGRLGEPSDAADLPLPGLLTILAVMTGLMAAVWAFSRFRYRSAVLIVQVGVVWVGGLLYGFDVRTHVTAWDVAESAVLLVTTLLQLLPGAGTAHGRAPTAREVGAADRTRPGPGKATRGETQSGSTDSTLELWRRVRKPLGAVLLVVIAVQNREGLTSGEPLPTVAAVCVTAFFGWLFLRPFPTFDAETSTADELRATLWREMGWWSAWTVLAVAIVGWASAVTGFQPPSLVAIAIPLLPLVGSAVGYRKVEATVARARANRVR